MINKLEEEIKAINENIDILPKKTKLQKEKVAAYIEDVLSKYRVSMDEINSEIDRRYQDYTSAKVDKSLAKLENNDIDFIYIKSIDTDLPSYFKMDLDYLTYKLNHFYQEDLEYTNETIREILRRFENAGIKLTSKDFNYTNYVYTYIDNLVNNNNVNNVLNSIYWECPEVFNQISLCFKYLYFKHKKTIDKYYINIAKGKKLSSEEERYNAIHDEVKRIHHSDKGYILSEFINKKLIMSDFTDANITKIKSLILLDDKDPNIYTNLLALEETLDDYKTYLDYQFIFDDLKKLYTDKKSYKGIFSNQLKAINKDTSKLFKYNKKLAKTGLFKLNKDKREETKLNINTTIKSLVDSYKLLDQLYIKDTIYTYVTDEMSLLFLLRLASEDFIYMRYLFKQRDEEITSDEIISNIVSFKTNLYAKDNSLLSNVRVGMDKNISQIISDRYKLCNFNITNEFLEKENIDTLITYVKVLIASYDIKKVGLELSNIDFVLNVNKMK